MLTTEVQIPEPDAFAYAISSLQAAWWNYERQIRALGYTYQDNCERRRLQYEQQALADVADWLEAQAARMHVP